MTSSVDNHAGSVVGPDDDVDVQETWWTGFISPYTLRFSPELEAQVCSACLGFDQLEQHCVSQLHLTP